MTKINFSELPNKIRQLELFDPQVGYRVDYLLFLESDLGRLWQKIPFEELSSSIAQRLVKQGVHVPSWGYLDIRGGLAVEVLKHYYAGLSDAKLLALVNQSKALQWFCFMDLSAGEQIQDKDLLVRWRQFLGEHLDWDALNRVQLSAWLGELSHPQLRLSDATVFEVKIAFPQSITLLYDACCWVFDWFSRLSKSLGLGCQGQRYKKFKRQHAEQTKWSKCRKKTHKMNQTRTRELLYWLEKGLTLLKTVWQTYQSQVVEGVQNKLPQRIEVRYKTIKTLFEQQHQRFLKQKEAKTAAKTKAKTKKKNKVKADSKIPDRIVSLQQPHIRPIPRGKDYKPCEFGPKVNMLRIGCINLVEHFSFDAFHEGNRMQDACNKYQHITGACKQFGGDTIYATKANRAFAKEKGIATCFKPTGRRKNDKTIRQQEDTARKEIGKIRSTHLEGSFGNQKQHYGLMKITAKTPHTQQQALFAALLTANAMALVGQDKVKEKIPPKPKPPPPKQLKLAA